MAYEHDRDDEEEELEERSMHRRSPPRFGPLLTIAVAILILFGAASRIGKTSEGGFWPSLDGMAEHKLQTQQEMKERERAKALLTLGIRPLPEGSGVPSREGPAAPIRPTHMPPVRDLEMRQSGDAGLPLMALSSEGYENDAYEGPNGNGFYHDPAPEATPQPQQLRPNEVYVVVAGDTWAKIGKRFKKRWEDIKAANPEGKDGLRVGMKLVIPDS